MGLGSVDTLFHPIQSGVMDTPDDNAKCLFLNAQLPADYGVRNAVWYQQAAHIQPRRSNALQLSKANVRAQRELRAEASGFTHIFILSTQSRAENEQMIAQAASVAAQNAIIVVSGAKTDGIQPLAKRLHMLGVEPESIAKHHAKALIFPSGDALQGLAHCDQCVEQDFITGPGMFSAGKVDPGSKLLAEYLPAFDNMCVADFGAGWGYLSATLSKRSTPAKIDLFENHWPSLVAAKRNTASAAPQLEIGTYWYDLENEPVERVYDAIVMNPPFHAGRQQKRSLGEAFIQRASSALKPQGSLWMVANRGLNYGPVLEGAFSRFETLAEANGFRVIHAKR